MGKGSRWLCVAVLGWSAGALGCQRLDYDKTLTIKPGELQKIYIDPPGRDQKLTVEVSIVPPGAPVGAWVVLDENLDAVVGDLKNGLPPGEGKVLAGKERIESATLETVIPAGKNFAVLLRASREGKETVVRVKVTGR
jgi:hypothetical protein